PAMNFVRKRRPIVVALSIQGFRKHSSHATTVKQFPAPMRTNVVLSKSAFIRSQPVGMSRAEIVMKAKAAGIDLSPQLVSAVRMQSRRGRRRSVPKKVPVSGTELILRLRTLTAAQREVARL